MRTLCSTLAIFLLLCACGEPERSSEPVEPLPGRPVLAGDLPGLWESTLQTPQGLSSFMRMHGDGRLEEGFALRVSARYEFDPYDQTLTFHSPDIEMGEDLKPVPVAFEGDVMHFGDPQEAGRQIAKTRVGEAIAGEHPVVGTWTYTHATGLPAYEKYLPDGTFLVRIPQAEQSNQGTWKLEDDTLVMDLGEGRVREAEASISEGALYLRLPGRDAITFTPSEHGAWYGVLTEDQLQTYIDQVRLAQEARRAAERAGGG